MPFLSPQIDATDSSVLHVIVNVKDINDNAPKFIKQIFTGGFTTETDYGTEFMRVKVSGGVKGRLKGLLDIIGFAFAGN
jgi:hypothetical protein